MWQMANYVISYSRWFHSTVVYIFAYQAKGCWFIYKPETHIHSGGGGPGVASGAKSNMCSYLPWALLDTGATERMPLVDIYICN